MDFTSFELPLLPSVVLQDSGHFSMDWPAVDVEDCYERLDAPTAITLRLPRPNFLVRSFVFPESPQSNVPAAKPKEKLPNASPPDKDSEAKKDKPFTRIKPPGDVIKLEDRLYYVLQ